MFFYITFYTSYRLLNNVIYHFQAKRLQEAFHQPFVMTRKQVEKTGDKQLKS